MYGNFISSLNFGKIHTYESTYDISSVLFPEKKSIQVILNKAKIFESTKRTTDNNRTTGT